jgi:hypothetical protein
MVVFFKEQSTPNSPAQVVKVDKSAVSVIRNKSADKGNRVYYTDE